MRTTNKQKNPFIMPERYTEEFTFRMMLRIDREGQTRPTASSSVLRRHLYQSYVRYAIGVAAVMAFFHVCTRTSLVEMQTNSPVAQQENKMMASTGKDAVYYYLMMNDQTLYDYEANNE